MSEEKPITTLSPALLGRMQQQGLAHVIPSLQLRIERGEGLDLDECQRMGVLNLLRLISIEWGLIPLANENLFVPNGLAAGEFFSEIRDRELDDPGLREMVASWWNEDARRMLHGVAIWVVVVEHDNGNRQIMLPHETPTGTTEDRTECNIKRGIDGL